ncbi:MAG TPA: AsmA-like C-terminal region-containing protein, partial [Myxococcota bacterium]|nr:AsmA-like C-terminal region-containing protein [Myxococcota bacterium]
FGGRLSIELERVRVADPAHPDGPPALEIEHALGVQAWPRLLAGQYLPLDWTLRGPVLRLYTGPSPAVPNLAGLPRLGLSVRDGRIELSSASETWSLRNLELDAQRTAFGTHVEGDGSGLVFRGDSQISEVALHFAVYRDRQELRGTWAGLDLAALPRGAISPHGRAQGDFALTLRGGGLHGSARVEVARFVLRVPKLSGPIAPAVARASADVDWHGDQLTLDLHPLTLDDLVANGTVRVGTGSAGRLALDLRLGTFQPAHRERVSGLTFLALRFSSWARVQSRIEAGIVEDIHLAIDVPRATAAESLSFDTPMPESAFSLQLRAHDGTYRPHPGEPPLEKLSGELDIRGNVMDVRHIRMTHRGEALPEVDVHLEGMHRLVHLPDAEDHVVGGPGVDLAGLAPMAAALQAGNAETTVPTVLHFDDLDMRLPAFMLPLRSASGSLRFPGGGVLADPVQGTLGGAPAQMRVRWDPAVDRVDVDVRYGEGAAPGGPITGPVWLRANIAFEELAIPEWPFEGLHAALSAERALVSFQSIEGRLASGNLSGSGTLDLSQPGRAPFKLDLSVAGFEPRPMCATFGLPSESVTGRGYAKMRMSGALRPGGSFSTEGRLEAKVELHDGTVARLPAMVAIARLPSLAGVTGLLGRPLPYKTVAFDLALADGRVAISDGKLLGPQLRILANGELNVAAPERQTDLVVALLFLQTLDRVLEQVPIVRNVVLGEDRNLIAVYLRVQGPRSDPSVTLLPPASVQSVMGFASKAVIAGVKRLGE